MVSFGLASSLGQRLSRNCMFATAIKLWKDEHGATAIEYGLITALISVAVIAAYQAVGTGLTNTFNAVSSKL